MSKIQDSYKNLNFWRGVMIIEMMIWHLFYNLKWTKLVDVDMSGFFFWLLIHLVLFKAVTITGIEAALLKKNGLSLKPSLKETFIFAIILSLFTGLMFGNSFIYFGIAHFLFVSFLLSEVLWNKKKLLGFIIATIFTITLIYGKVKNVPVIDQMFEGSYDYVHFIPWFGFFAAGLLIGNYDSWKRIPAGKSKILEWLGAHGLTMYMSYQILTITIFNIIKFVI